MLSVELQGPWGLYSGLGYIGFGAFRGTGFRVYGFRGSGASCFVAVKGASRACLRIAQLLH